MPHLHLEYSTNLPALDTAKALLRLNHALVASGQFGAEFDIKSRALKVDDFRVGTAQGERGFVAVKLALLSGRSPETKQQLSANLLAVLQDLAEWPAGMKVQLSVELLDIDRDSYSKVAVGH